MLSIIRDIAKTVSVIKLITLVMEICFSGHIMFPKYHNITTFIILVKDYYTGHVMENSMACAPLLCCYILLPFFRPEGMAVHLGELVAWLFSYSILPRYNPWKSVTPPSSNYLLESHTAGCKAREHNPEGDNAGEIPASRTSFAKIVGHGEAYPGEYGCYLEK
jgi:hypothetical protein